MTNHEATASAAGVEAPARQTYAEASAELDTILSELDGPDLDVDALAAHVRRAAELIRLCRSRIEATSVEVEQIVKQLDADAGAALPPERGEPEDEPEME